MRTAIIIIIALTVTAGAFALTYGPFPIQATEDPVFYNELGYHLSQQGDLEGAQDAFEKAVNIKDDYENARKNLAVAAFQNGDYLTAIEHGRVLAARHGTQQYHFDLAQALVAQARFAEDSAEESVAYLFEAVENLKAAGDYPNAKSNLAIVNRVLDKALN